MADLDNAVKRASSTQMLLWSLQSPPLPGGTIGALVRQALAHTYAGIQSVYTGAGILLQMLLHSGG